MGGGGGEVGSGIEGRVGLPVGTPGLIHLGVRCGGLPQGVGGCGAYASRECVFHIVVPFDWATGKATPVNTMAFGVSQFLRQNRGHALRLLHEHCFFLGGGGGGTRPWWLALLACEAAYWPLALEPSVLTFVRGGGCVGGGIREKGKGVLGGVGQGGGGA